MNFYVHENHLVNEIRARFPDEASLTDDGLIARGWNPADQDGTAYTWVEAFADRTNAAIKRRDAAAVVAQTGFLAEQYRTARDSLCPIIDVAYAENLMWDADNADKAWAWEFIALEIQQLHASLWGSPIP